MNNYYLESIAPLLLARKAIVKYKETNELNRYKWRCKGKM